VLDGRRTGDDVVWDGPASIEVKDVTKLDLSGWLRQAQEQAGDRPAVVWHKKRGTADAEGWYVTMSGQDFLRLIGDWEWYVDIATGIRTSNRPSTDVLTDAKSIE
jgi:hypothetical protein